MIRKKKPSRKKPVSRPKKKGLARAKTATKRKKQSPKGKKPVPQGDQLGKVVAFFRIPVVAVVKVAKGSLKVGDSIWIKGHTTDLKQTVASMQVNHQPIQEARKGAEVGLKISSRARRGDRVYRL
jgi:translation initiation factor IF-2